MIELTENQVRAIQLQDPTPLQMVDPASGQVFVLIRKDVYDATRNVVAGGQGRVWDDEADDDLIASKEPIRKRA